IRRSVRPCFFFRAEGGIGGKVVTGVQACALPISLAAGGGAATRRRAAAVSGLAAGRAAGPPRAAPAAAGEREGRQQGGRSIETQIGRASCREREEMSHACGGEETITRWLTSVLGQ